ncbi:hypothetical protein LTR47_011802 [Exophiala xenobiotica]|nr:hypothetical protein LTR92_010709 [Exophiala xenobiotica]KAK5203255.1 hypothetical protein LTR41_010979 [Exophiala xenobiotica]KAK5217858.1 hypothetical protein LTR47_011802 [Exophiala xenobiotica]KAK5243124.1 hypothetical protein LTS06_011041 [Exophiala xenobiotica]KAK5281411.1 hypothetical protein LTR40_004891 [Exophiala xenobiotica]
MSLNCKTVVFDPCGDVCLLLEVPSEARADDNNTLEIPARDATAGDAPVSETPTLDLPVDDASTHNLSAGDAPADDIPVDHDPADDVFNPIPVDDVTLDHGDAAKASEHIHDAARTLSTETIRSEIELRVSSKHLSLASAVFDKSMEGHSIGDTDMRTIPLQNDDYHAMEILLNIIHGRTRRVPRRLNIEELVQVVVLIDKYEFHEAVEPFTDMWFESLRPVLLRQEHQDLGSRIFICWVLQKSSEYNALTRKAIWDTDSGFKDEAGVAPDWIVREIQSCRQAILTEVTGTLSGLFDRYQGWQEWCQQNQDCDPLVLGKLLRGLRNFGLYPLPEPSALLNLSVQELFSDIRSLELSPLCGANSKKAERHSLYFGDECFVHMDEELRDSLLRIENGSRGLELHAGSSNDHSGL